MSLRTLLPRHLVVLAIVSLLAGGAIGGLLWGQEEERRRGDFRGGDSRGGESRGGDSGGSRFGGGSSRGGGEEFIRGLDVNKNGMIDPNEVEGPAKFFLPRLASEAGLDPAQPMPLDKLLSAREKMRSSGGGGFAPGGPGGGFSPGGPMGPGGSSDRGSERGRDDRSRDDRERDRDRESRPSEASTSKAPLVPGFGEDLKLASVAGFGEGAVGGTSTSGHDPKAEEYVNDLLKRYDKNKNGLLEQEEWKEGRWSPDATESDTNRDTKLTRDELLARFVRRNAMRTSSSSDKGSGGSSGGSAPMSGGGDSSSSDPDGKLLRFAESMMSRYDENKDGILQKEEWANMRGDPAAADKNRDGLITKEELAERLGSFGGGGGGPGGGGSWGGPPGGGGPGGGGPGGGGFGGGGREREGREGREGGGFGGGSSGSSSASSKGSTKTTGGKVYKFTSPTARLPKGIPSWFTRNDANGDGQVVMSEFSTTWNDTKIGEFNKYDADGDGLITAEEAVAADKKK